MTENEAIRDLDIIRFNPHWDELVNECGKVRDKYKNSNLCSRLLMVIIQDLEERSKHID